MSDDRHDRVSRRAYELWEQQGGEHGRHEDHWHRASAEVDRPAPTDTEEGQATVAAPDGTTLNVSDQGAGEKPARKRAAPKPDTAEKTPPRPRKPKAK